MRIFQSEQVIKLRNVLVLFGKKRMATESRIRQMSNNCIITCGAPMLGHYQKYTQKQSNIAKLKTALLSIWNDLP